MTATQPELFAPPEPPDQPIPHELDGTPNPLKLDPDELRRRFVRVYLHPEPLVEWQVVGQPNARRGMQVGRMVATLGFHHASGTEHVLWFPDGKLESFACHGLQPPGPYFAPTPGVKYPDQPEAAE